MKYFLSCLLLLTSAHSARAGTWNLPATLDTGNTTVQFIVDTTWHTVHGEVKSLSGNAELTDPNDFKSIQLKISVPVISMDTQNSDRDEEMRSSMNAATFPTILFSLSNIPQICNPATLLVGEPYNFDASGEITIRDVKKIIPISATVTKADSGELTLQGKSKFRWLDFGITDPSIFIAKVKPDVTILFTIKLPKGHP